MSKREGDQEELEVAPEVKKPKLKEEATTSRETSQEQSVERTAPEQRPNSPIAGPSSASSDPQLNLPNQFGLVPPFHFFDLRIIQDGSSISSQEFSRSSTGSDMATTTDMGTTTYMMTGTASGTDTSCSTQVEVGSKPSMEELGHGLEDMEVDSITTTESSTSMKGDATGDKPDNKRKKRQSRREKQDEKRQKADHKQKRHSSKDDEPKQQQKQQ